MIEKEQADDKVKSGYLRIWLGFDALAIREDVAKSALDSLIAKLDDDKRVRLYKKDFGCAQKVENPFKGVAEAWSVMAEIELVSKNLSDVVSIVAEYGPSAIELLEPNKFGVDAGEAQAVLNSVAEMMHKFAAAGVGGAVIVRGK